MGLEFSQNQTLLPLPQQPKLGLPPAKDVDDNDGDDSDIHIDLICSGCATRLRNDKVPTTVYEHMWLEAIQEFREANPKPTKCDCCGKQVSVLTSFPDAGDAGMWLCDSQARYFSEHGNSTHRELSTVATNIRHRICACRYVQRTTSLQTGNARTAETSLPYIGVASCRCGCATEILRTRDRNCP